MKITKEKGIRKKKGKRNEEKKRQNKYKKEEEKKIQRKKGPPPCSGLTSGLAPLVYTCLNCFAFKTANCPGSLAVELAIQSF